MILIRRTKFQILGHTSHSSVTILTELSQALLRHATTARSPVVHGAFFWFVYGNISELRSRVRVRANGEVSGKDYKKRTKKKEEEEKKEKKEEE